MESVRFYKFTSKCGKTHSIPANKARLHFVTPKNSAVKCSSYSLTFNGIISREITRNGLKYVRLGENTLTGELFLQFTPAKTPDTLNLSILRNKDPEKTTVTIYNKQFVEFLIQRFSITEDEAVSIDLNVSDNKSHTSGIAVVLINK